MPIVYDEDGLRIQTQTEIRDETYDELDAAFGTPVHRNPLEDPIAQIVETLAESEALTQQALLALVRARDPDGAIGRPLDAAVGLTGTTRKGATRSFVDGEIEFDAAATVSNGHRFRHDDTNEIWEVTDGPHVASGAESIAAQLTAVETGPLVAPSGSSWSAVTVVAGVVGFTNASESATVGRDREQDTTLQRRRKRELYAQGQGPLRAIEGAVSKVEGVVSVRAYHNPSTSPADADGIPFKALNVVVETNPSTPTAAQENAIRKAIWDTLGAGGHAYGTDVTGTHTDSEGTAQPVDFDLVEVVDIALELELDTSTSEIAASPNLTDDVAAAMLELAQGTTPSSFKRETEDDHQVPGRDVKALDYAGEVARLQAKGLIAGVDGVTVKMSIDPASPTEVTKISIGIRQRAAFDAARITVAEV